MLLNNFSILWSLYLVSNQYSIPPAYSLSPVFRITVNIFLIFLLSLFIKTAAGEGYSQCLLLFLSIHKPSFFLFFSFFFSVQKQQKLIHRNLIPWKKLAWFLCLFEFYNFFLSILFQLSVRRYDLNIQTYSKGSTFVLTPNNMNKLQDINEVLANVYGPN